MRVLNYVLPRFISIASEYQAFYILVLVALKYT